MFPSVSSASLSAAWWHRQKLEACCLRWSQHFLRPTPWRVPTRNGTHVLLRRDVVMDLNMCSCPEFLLILTWLKTEMVSFKACLLSWSENGNSLDSCKDIHTGRTVHYNGIQGGGINDGLLFSQQKSCQESLKALGHTVKEDRTYQTANYLLFTHTCWVFHLG